MEDLKYSSRIIYLINPKRSKKMNIYVSNLASDVNEEDLNNLFSEYGKVSSAKVIRDMFSQESRGFGFV